MIREYRDKPRVPLIKLLNDLADRGAILDLLGVPAAEADRDLLRYAGRRIAPARPYDDSRDGGAMGGGSVADRPRPRR